MNATIYHRKHFFIFLKSQSLAFLIFHSDYHFHVIKKISQFHFFCNSPTNPKLEMCRDKKLLGKTTRRDSSKSWTGRYDPINVIMSKVG